MMRTFALLAPLVAAIDYAMHEKIPTLVNNVGPFHNPAESYKFYSLPFCKPAEQETHSQGLGEVLAGDRLYESKYDIRFKVDVQWQELCKFKLTTDDIAHFIKAISEHYIFEMRIDELPVKGFVGEMSEDGLRSYLFTHLDFSIAYNGDNVIACTLTTDPEKRIELIPGQETDVEFSFGVHWKFSDTTYPDRLELHSQQLIGDQLVEIHWLSIINSFVLILLLVAFLGMIFLRVLKKDFARYMELDDEDFDDQDDSGWKLVHGDVFRFPEHPMLLSAAVGTGCQLLVLAFCLTIIAIIGEFYPGNHSSLYTAAVLLYALTAVVAGYVSTTLYIKFDGDKWATNAVLTACLWAVPFFLMFCVVNTMAISYQATSAMPFGTIMVIILIWALVTFPLTVFGAMRARSTAPYAAPCKTNRVPREIPPGPWFKDSMILFVLAGFLPFSSIYIELHYIFASIWGHRAYTLFEVMALAFIMLLVVTAAVSVALTYFQLVAEDYQWWWRSFLMGTSTGVFMFAYAIFYFNHRSDMSGALQTAFFFGYVALISYAFSLMLGAVSFLVSHKFVRHIYSSIKVD